MNNRREPLESGEVEMYRLLVECRMITEEELQASADEAYRSGKSLGAVLMERNCLPRRYLGYAVNAYCHESPRRLP